LTAVCESESIGLARSPADWRYPIDFAHGSVVFTDSYTWAEAVGDLTLSVDGVAMGADLVVNAADSAGMATDSVGMAADAVGEAPDNVSVSST
jgi:hypothetical protein